MNHKLGAAVSFACMLFSTAAIGASATGAADARFRSIYGSEWKWRVAQNLASDEDRRDNVKRVLPHVDAKTQQARLAYWQGVMRQLDGVKPAELSAAERINYDVYRAQIAAFIEALRFREYEQPSRKFNGCIAN